MQIFYFRKNTINTIKKEKNRIILKEKMIKKSPKRGIEPRSPAWQAGILDHYTTSDLYFLLILPYFFSTTGIWKFLSFFVMKSNALVILFELPILDQMNSKFLFGLVGRVWSESDLCRWSWQLSLPKASIVLLKAFGLRRLSSRKSLLIVMLVI